jgi:lipid-A-disaccharide synthase
MIVIFPFEERLYLEAGVPVTFVGHPLVDLVSPPADPRRFLADQGLDPDREVLAVLPGSRPQEVRHNLPPLAAGLVELRRRRPELQLLLALAPSLDPASVREGLAALDPPVRVVPDATHEILGSATAALVASGTATVEAALLGAPMAVVYRLSALTYALGRPFVRVRHYAMVNLIAEREVVPEIIQHEFTPERVAREADSLLADEQRRKRMKQDLAEVRRRLGAPGASRRAAEVVAELLGPGGGSPS